MKDDHKTKKQLIDELTELRSQNAALKKSESPDKYRSLVENIRDVIYELDSQGVVLYISPTIKDLLGYDSTEIVGKNFIELAHKDDLSSRAEWFSELRKGIESPSEYRIIDKSGEYKWAQTKVRPIIEDGQLKGAFGILIDVTAHKRMEEALRESEEKYRLSFENVADVIYMIDTNLNILSLSPSVERILGYKPQDFIGRPATDLAIIFTPESFEQAIADASLILKGETIAATIYQFITKDGTIKHGEVSGSPVMRDGKIIGIISVARDITDRKLAEERLLESEEKYRWVLNNMADVITVMDMNLRFTYVSPSIMRMRGYTPEEALAQTFEQVMTPESLQISAKVFEEEMTLEAGGTADPDRLRSVEVEQYRKDGSIVLMENHLSFIRDEAKKAVGIISVSHDITERKEAEDKIKKQSDAMESAIDGIAILNKDEEYAYLNQAHARIFGYENAGELIGKSWRTLYCADEIKRFDAEIMPKFGKEGFWQGETLGMKKDGSKFPQAISLTALDGGGLICIVRDITERKQVAEELQRTLESLRKSFAATIQVMVSAVESRDPYTAGHQIRSANLARCIATEMGLPKEKIEGIRMAGSIHDIGKLSIPAEILSKPTKLTNLEFSLIKEHSLKGYEMLKDVESPWPLAEIVYQHHERMDGTGYPRNLKGEDIILEARIMAVSDVVESMASHRPYRPAIGIKEALEEIEKNKGILYDDAVADACLRLFREKGFQLAGT